MMMAKRCSVGVALMGVIMLLCGCGGGIAAPSGDVSARADSPAAVTAVDMAGPQAQTSTVADSGVPSKAAPSIATAAKSPALSHGGQPLSDASAAVPVSPATVVAAVSTLCVGLGANGHGWFEGFTINSTPSTIGGVSTFFTPTNANWGQLSANNYPNFAQAPTYVCSGDVDGDGLDELVVGTGPAGGGQVYVYKYYTGGYTLMATLQMSNFAAYTSSSDASTFPACVDIDGSGRAAIVVGTGANGQGYAQIWKYNLQTKSFAPLAGTPYANGYVRVGWSDYDASSDGSVHPAGGHIAGHGAAAQLVLGLGASGQGWMQIWTWNGSALVPFSLTPVQNGWIQVAWSGYNVGGNAPTWPAVGDYDGDGYDDLVVGLGNSGQGWIELFKSQGGTLQPDSWQQVAWPAYTQSGQAAVHPAMGDFDGDGKADIALGLSPAGGGWLYVLRTGGGARWSDSWAQIAWPAYNASGDGSSWPAFVRGGPVPAPTPSPAASPSPSPAASPSPSPAASPSPSPAASPSPSPAASPSPSPTASTSPSPAASPSPSPAASPSPSPAASPSPSPAASPSPSPGASPSPSPTIIPPDNPGSAAVTFTVDSSAQRQAIQPYIYGINSMNFSGRPANVTLSRLGGNRWTAYNWTNNASNAGTDYLNQNDAYLGGGSVAGGAVAPHVTDANAHNASMIVTVPMAGYVAADTLGNGDVNQTPNYLQTRFRVSQARKGSAFQYPPSLSGTVYQDEFVAWLESQFPNARTNSSQTIFYSLDNEPDLWPSTHPRIHPSATTYAEMVSRTTDFAGAIKAVAPNALVFGPVNYGWEGYVNLQNAPDAGGRDFLSYYLDQMQAAQNSAGHRLVDVLDVHWYPEATGGGARITDEGAGQSEADARVQAPRSLWDTTYTETSWITQYSTLGPIQLLPRLKQKIAAHYPGTRIAISEYNYGGSNDISGAMAQADVLGVFGQQGVFAATMWPLTSTPAFIYGGFEIYRNFDGQGGKFGDTSIAAATTDVNATSLFASVDQSTPNRLVIVAINKTRAPLTTALRVSHTVLFSRAEVYQLTSASSSPVHGSDVSITLKNAVKITLPAMSVTTLVLKP